MFLHFLISSHHRVLVSLICAIVVGCAALPSVAHAEGPVLHVVLVFDMDALDIKKHLELDLSALRAQFITQVRADHLHLVERTGSLNRTGVRGIFANGRVADVPVAPNDAVVFVFDGHGSFDPDRKDLVFALRSSGEHLYRDEVLQGVLGCKPRLAVVINGSCTNIVKKSTIFGPAESKELENRTEEPFSAAFRKLFVDSRGSVLLSAARPGQFAAAFPGVAAADGNSLIFFGTLFGQSLASEFRLANTTEEPPRDWPELAKRLQQQVANDYKKFIVPIDAFPGQATQTVAATIELGIGTSIVRWGVSVAPAPNGLKLESVAADSWAAGANLRVGDIIVALNNTELDTPSDLRTFVDALSIDTQFRVVGLRADGQSFSFLRRLKDGVGQQDAAGRLGVTVAAVDQGLRLVTVETGSLAKQLGFEPGDTLVSLNGRPTRQAADLGPALDAIGSDGKVKIEVISVNTNELFSVTKTAGN
jgi:PDZ domain